MLSKGVISRNRKCESMRARHIQCERAVGDGGRAAQRNASGQKVGGADHLETKSDSPVRVSGNIHVEMTQDCPAGWRTVGRCNLSRFAECCGVKRRPRTRAGSALRPGWSSPFSLTARDHGALSWHCPSLPFAQHTNTHSSHITSLVLLTGCSDARATYQHSRVLDLPSLSSHDTTRVVSVHIIVLTLLPSLSFP